MIRTTLGAIVMALFLFGCTSTTLTTSFDPKQAAFINTQGSASITGQAFLRRNDGIVVYAAGSEVTLIPKTPYSDERIAAIYGGGKISYFGANFKNDVQEYYQYTRKTVADGEGRFTFNDVASGSYYVTTSVIWMVQYVQQGGALMERVTVSNGQKASIIMSGR